MPCRGGPTPCPCQIQVVIKQACSLAKAINVDPASREFDRQGDTIQTPTDAGRNRRISIDQLKLSSHGPHALDQQLKLDPGAAEDALVEAMKGHILEQVTLTGKYKRG